MRNLLKANRNFFLPYIFFLVFGAYFLLSYRPETIMLWINAHTYAFLDNYFLFLTYIGDGLAYTILAILLIGFQFRKSIQAWILFGLSSLTAQFLKRAVFASTLRPYAYFQSMHIPVNSIRLVPGVQIYMQNSFPSGHAATGMSLALLLCFWVKNKAYAPLFLVLGLSIAYSRMYLFEHFLWDCWAGSLIGVVLTLLGYALLDHSQFPKGNWASKGLKDFIRRKGKHKNQEKN